MDRRSATISVPTEIEIGLSPIVIRGYDKAGKFVCRLEITSAGVNVFAGAKGGKQVNNLTWEGLVKVLREDAS